MPRNCNCAGGCAPQPDGVTRREFISLVGAGAATTILSGPALAEHIERLHGADSLAEWKAGLHKKDAPHKYLSDKHTDARMHLGGIGTGNFEIGSDGRFSTWQLFNTLRD